MNKQGKRKEKVNTGVDAAASALGAGIGLVGGTPGILIGAAMGPVLADFVKRKLSKKEETRIEIVIREAKRIIEEKVEKEGGKIRDDFDKEKFGTLLEGVLMKARDSYEDKKVLLLANLAAVAPFTNTPIENLISTLSLAEKLSYRELCLLAIVGKNQYGTHQGLSDEMLKNETEKISEVHQGIYGDLFSMSAQNLLAQRSEDGKTINVIWTAYDIVPSRLTLLYRGMLLFNGLRLGTSIGRDDLHQPLAVLK